MIRRRARRSARECFPEALRFKLGPDGVLTDEREEPIAADAREQGDGKDLAKRKVVAALLGVRLDEIARRAERARKRRNGLCRAGKARRYSLHRAGPPARCRILSSAEKCRRVARRMPLIACSAGSFVGTDFCSSSLLVGYDEPEILPSSTHPICLMGADGEQALILPHPANSAWIEFSGTTARVRECEPSAHRD